MLLAWACLALLVEPVAEAAGDPETAPGAFAADCAAKAAAAEKAGALAAAGRDGWWFLAAELRHLGAGPFWGEAAAKASRAAKPDEADPLPAIVDLKRQLDAAGVELLVVPVPAKAAIYPDALSDRVTAAAGAAPPRADAADQAFLQVLSGAGVKAVDLAPEFLANRFHKDGPLFCKTDSHWSGNGCVVAARQIAAQVRDRPWLAAAAKMQVASQWRTVEIAGDLVSGAGKEGPAGASGKSAPPERVPIRFVGEKTGEDPELIPPNRASPILLLGDSSNLVFHAGGDMHAVGAGLPDQLALELGLAVDLVAVRGSGATAARMNLARRCLADPNYLKGKRLVIWCFAAREFTEADGWRKVTLTKEPAKP